ncbi:MAG: hypothetical protein WB729_12265 [Candidatus Sulfotelmatobacter sp.]
MGAKKTVRAKQRKVNSVFLVQLRKMERRIFADRHGSIEILKNGVAALAKGGFGNNRHGRKDNIEETMA